MSHLRVYVLGGMSVVGGGHVIAIAGSCRAVLAYLLTHRHRHVSRLELAETVWADRARDYARRCLSTALWRLKASMGAHAALLASHGDEELSFNWATTWVDCVAFEMRLVPLLRHNADALTTEDIGRLERGVRLYRGDYLIGMDQEWAQLERQRIRSIYCDSLHLLMLARASRSQWHEALAWGRHLTREEPLREDVHRLLMLAYAKTGNRASALALYRQCQRALAADLGVEPMPETQELYRQLARSSVPLPQAPFVDSTPSLASAQRRIRRVRQALTVSQHQLDTALGELEARSSGTH